MSQQTTTKCDNCGKIKQESNHWWKVVVSTKDNVLICHDDYDKDELHDSKYCNGDLLYDSCGQECTLAMVSKVMGGGKISVGGNQG